MNALLNTTDTRRLRTPPQFAYLITTAEGVEAALQEKLEAAL